MNDASLEASATLHSPVIVFESGVEHHKEQFRYYHIARDVTHTCGATAYQHAVMTSRYMCLECHFEALTPEDLKQFKVKISYSN